MSTNQIHLMQEAAIAAACRQCQECQDQLTANIQKAETNCKTSNKSVTDYTDTQ